MFGYVQRSCHKVVKENLKTFYRIFDFSNAVDPLFATTSVYRKQLTNVTLRYYIFPTQLNYNDKIRAYARQ